MEFETGHRPGARHRFAFTLIELLVSMAVLALLVALIGQLFSSAQSVIGTENKHMDADAQARLIFDRMAVDFGQMIKRADVDCFLKDPTTTQTGNDQLAFYSHVPGYYPSTGSQSPVSIVGYRVNGDASGPNHHKLQRFGAGLVWNGVSPSDTPVVFSPQSTSSLPNTISDNWPEATNMDADSKYELAGPQVFRMEYSYLLKGQTSPAGTEFPSTLSSTPWETRLDTNGTGLPYRDSVAGMRDVAAIAMVIAIIDPKSKVLVTDVQLASLAGKMNDFSDTMEPGDLENQWMAVINDPSNGLPRSAAAALRVYGRYFYLSPSPGS